MGLGDSNEEIVFCFDRDATIDIGRWPGPIPIEWVQFLSEETQHEVYATGNQRLKEEADIPGTSETKERLPSAIALQYASPSRRERLEIVKFITDKDRYIVVDDADLNDVEDFEYYSPESFIAEFESEFLHVCKPENEGEHPFNRE